MTEHFPHAATWIKGREDAPTDPASLDREVADFVEGLSALVHSAVKAQGADAVNAVLGDNFWSTVRDQTRREVTAAADALVPRLKEGAAIVVEASVEEAVNTWLRRNAGSLEATATVRQRVFSPIKAFAGAVMGMLLGLWLFMRYDKATAFVYAQNTLNQTEVDLYYVGAVIITILGLIGYIIGGIVIGQKKSVPVTATINLSGGK